MFDSRAWFCYKSNMALESLKSIHKKTSALLWILNVSDLIFTLFLIGSNLATEGNPLLSYMLDHSVWAFVAVKMTVSTAGILFLRRYPDRAGAVIGTAFLCGIYASLFFFQAVMTLRDMV